MQRNDGVLYPTDSGKPMKMPCRGGVNWIELVLPQSTVLDSGGTKQDNVEAGSSGSNSMNMDAEKSGTDEASAVAVQKASELAAAVQEAGKT